MKNFLQHPLAANLDLDSPDAPLIHRQIINSKPFLQNIYQEWYQEIIRNLPDHPGRNIIELGSGGGNLQNILPDIITSNIHPTGSVNIVLDGQCLPFSTASLDAIVMVDVFHHLPDVDKFFKESIRCLAEKGRIIMIEPWITTLSAVIYKHLHHEPCLPDRKSWDFPTTGPLSGANLALPWIVFERDRNLYLDRYSPLKIKTIRIDWPFVYLLSGGVSMKTLVPERSYPLVRKMERLLSPIMKHLAMFAIIVLEKE
ncbi:class I SAM-dependent methyltransferase [Candidatus Electronema sp. JM]|uniref:class I SAM-dependent methyltransferase n=1 Tax=Candidatus Electronema sp. JM TaxID=3401571 RepID=UPI003AA7E215